MEKPKLLQIEEEKKSTSVINEEYKVKDPVHKQNIDKGYNPPPTRGTNSRGRRGGYKGTYPMRGKGRGS